ncbi:polygalacturonase [Xylariaceae sp. FL0804]|nr:polygalacturonase [Xylariaceae sp. FL0804]
MLTRLAYGAVFALLARAAFASVVVSPYTGRAPIPRPDIQPFPHNSGRSMPPSPPRTRHCFVRAGGGNSSSSGGGNSSNSSSSDHDDAAAILQAFRDCNHGGTVVLDGDYTIGTALDLTFLEAVDVALSGRVTFSADVAYWTANAFAYAFQDARAFWRFGGRDVNVYGGGEGVIDGGGQVWWEAFAANDSLLRPVSLTLDGLHGGTVSGLRMVKPPSWFNFIANSSDVIVSDMDLVARSSDADVPVKNSDGWDVYRSSHLVIQDSRVDNTDDCFAFKPNSSDVVVQGLRCNGSHGISVGSLGQYLGEFDVVENAYVFNNTMAHASDAARIKVWPGVQSDFQPTLSGGGGSGYVRNVTYERYHSLDNDWAIEVDQCYGQDNQTLCELYPSNVTISDIWFIDMWGTTSTANEPYVGSLVCSSPEQCSDFHARNVSITAPDGQSLWICSNFNTTGLEGFDCVNQTST